MRFEFHPEALNEFQDSVLYYADQQTGLDLSFVLRVEEAIAQIQEDPCRFSVLEEDVRRCLVHVFPFGILYTVEPEYILILAVAHCSREPGHWKHRLG